MKELFKKPRVYWIIGIAIVYLTLNVIFSEFYITLRYIPAYLNEIHWGEILTSMVFVLITSILVALNSVSAYLKFKERKNIKKNATLSCAATIGGLTTGVCPACVTGLFPLILSSVGVSFSWSMLPFKGLEIQLLIIIILSTSLYYLHKK